ncbi:MAG TPA: hypothetical protein PKX93_00085 [bacterium]|nr:hypothetical protein [bacterium]HOL65839.1 hypothetical protein [bacterium]HPP11111.1 hypothetical protein [bacterium]
MRKLILIMAVAGIAHSCFPLNFQDRLVWLFGFKLTSQVDTDNLVSLIEQVAKNNYNGVVLSGGLDSLCKQDEKYFEGLEKIKKACEQFRLELIPAVFSVGYGSVLAHDRNLTEGLPVKEALFQVKGNQALFVPEKTEGITNGGFEEYQGNRAAGYRFHDEPGKISFIDTAVSHSGKASLRFENFTVSPHGHGRVMQEVSVIPYRCYRATIQVKTENLKPSGNFRLLALGDSRDLAPRSYHLPASADWKKLTLVFNSMEFNKVKLYAGIWGGKEGKFWVDDWKIEEVGLYNVLRRPGTPVVVKSAEDNTVFEEGKDYEKIFDPYLNPYRRDLDYPAPAIKILPGSRIKDGTSLRVSWYHPLLIYDSQVTVCMAEPSLYEIFDHEARLLWEKLRYKKVFLNMDEVRMGGTCKACEGKNMAALLGECVRKQVEILKRYNPQVQPYIWSDMFDPYHNARPDYYLVRGDFTGSWNYLPREVVIALWGGKPREKSLKFFTDNGFKILIANYHDADTLDEVKGWWNIAENFPGVRGFLYTTWQKKYKFLADYARMLFSKN